MWMQPGSKDISQFSDMCTSQLGPAAGFRLLESSYMTLRPWLAQGWVCSKVDVLLTLQTLSFSRFLFTQIKVYVKDILQWSKIYEILDTFLWWGTDSWWYGWVPKECPEVGVQISLMCGVVLFHSCQEGRRDCCPQTESFSPAEIFYLTPWSSNQTQEL